MNKNLKSEVKKESIIIVFLKQYVELVRRTSSFSTPTIYEFVLVNGKEFEKGGKVSKGDYGKMKECYRNAFLLMIDRSDLFYCEGFATFSGLLLPVLHAWCVDKDGKVYDPTWKDGGDEFYGVAFNRKFASSRTLKNGMYGLIDDWYHHWPLLSGKDKKWRAEL